MMALTLSVVSLTGLALAILLRTHEARIKPWMWPLIDLSPLLYVWGVAVAILLYFQGFIDIEGPRYLGSAYGAVALLGLPVALLRGRGRGRGAGVIIALISLLAFADTVYYRHFQTLIPLLALSATSQVWDARQSVLELIHLRDAWYLAPGLSGIAFALLWPGALHERAYRRKRLLGRAVLGGLLVALLLIGGGLIRWGFSGDWRIYSWDHHLARYGIFNTHNLSLTKQIREWFDEREISEEGYRAISAYMKARHAEIEASLPPADPIAPGANLLMIQVEGLQGWVINTRAYGEEITPYLNQLVARGHHFPNVWDQTASTHTADGEYLALNGLHPLSKGSVYFRRPENQFVALPWLLKQRGYHTMSAHAYERTMWNRAAVYPALGFDELYFRAELGEEPKIEWGLADIAFARKVVPLIEAQRAPWMALVITLTNHHPFKRLDEADRFIDVGKLEGSRLGNYIELVRYTDEAIKTLCEGLEVAGQMEDTLIAVYGDHDARFGFKPSLFPYAFRALDLPRREIRALAERAWPMEKVPFILAHSKRYTPRVIESAGGQLDIAPTTLFHLGYPRSRSMMGRPLLGQETRMVRWDEAAADQDHIMQIRGDGIRCWDHQLKLVEEAECAPLREQTEELERSRAITLHDLAMRLYEEGIEEEVGR